MYHVCGFILWLCYVGAQPQRKVEISGLFPQIIAIAVNSRTISETAEKAGGRSIRFLKCCLLRQGYGGQGSVEAFNRYTVEAVARSEFHVYAPAHAPRVPGMPPPRRGRLKRHKFGGKIVRPGKK